MNECQALSLQSHSSRFSCILLNYFQQSVIAHYPALLSAITWPMMFIMVQLDLKISAMQQIWRLIHLTWQSHKFVHISPRRISGIGPIILHECLVSFTSSTGLTAFDSHEVVVSDVVGKTSTRRRSRIPCIVIEKKSTNFQQKFLRFTYSNNAH